MRLSQDITLYLAEIGLDIEGWNDELGKTAWVDDPIWQPTREAIESIMGCTDYLEQYFAINIIFEPLVGELFRSGFLMQAAAANGDPITASVISSAEADYERNLANTIDLIYLLVNDETHGTANKTVFQGWIAKHGALADKAAAALQPIWSQPHSKPVSFADSQAVSHERLGKILGELGLDR